MLIEWRGQPKQAVALSRGEFEVATGGAKGGGKTETGIAWLTEYVENPNYQALIVRKDVTDLAGWIRKARRIYTGMGATFVQGRIDWPSGAVMYLGHLKDEEGYSKYMGNEYQRMLVEELENIAREEDYENLISNCRSSFKEMIPQVFSSFNPGGVGHAWIKKRFSIPNDPFAEHVTIPIITIDPRNGFKRAFIPMRLQDNPKMTETDPEYGLRLKGLSPTKVKAWLQGRWDLQAGQFFSQWAEEKHVVRPFPVPDSWALIRSIDPSGRYGITSCHWGAVDHDGVVWIYREYYWDPDVTGVGRDTDEHAKEIARLSAGEEYKYTVIDSAAFAKLGFPESQAEQYERHGVHGLIPAMKDRVPGWDLVHQYLRWDEKHLPRLRFFSICVNAIRTFPEMIHDKRNIEDLDTNMEDHAEDDIRYLIQPLRSQAPKSPPPEGVSETTMRIFERHKERLAREARLARRR